MVPVTFAYQCKRWVMPRLSCLPVLDVEPPGEGAAQITHQRLIGRWLPEGILCQEIQQLLSLGLEGW